VINGGSANGIQLLGDTANHNTVTGCYIGTDPTGTATVPNFANGIALVGAAHHNQIGGTSPARRNLISGNRNGVQITGADTDSTGNNVVQGNYIGVDRTGTVGLGNLAIGVSITGSNDNLIGGTDPGAGNVSSGNTSHGVRITGLFLQPDPDVEEFTINPALRNIVQGNLLGTNAAGTGAIPNVVDGVRLNIGAQQTTVGGTTPAARNICSGNTAHGVHLDESRDTTIQFSAVSQNTIQGNFVGTDISGALPLGNLLPGVVIFFGPTDNLIGGTGSGEGNLIAFNTGGFIDDGLGGMIFVPGDGINITFDPDFSDPLFVQDPVLRNRVSGNSIHSNNGLGIDLSLIATSPDAQDGPTPNDAGDPDDGPNEFQNFPVLTSVVSAGPSTTVTGSLNSTPNTTFSIEFFANTDCDPSGFGEGETFIGATTVATNGSGDASFVAVLPTNIGCRSVTATATDPDGNTSEFSNCKNEAPVATCSVATTELWPPNHNLINVGLSVVATDNCPSPVVSIQVFSDEDDEAPTGDGNFSPDAKNIAPGTLRLRSERNGGGDGRVYLIIITVTDSSGNVVHCCQTVTVPKSQSNASRQSVAAQAAAASAFCEQNGAAPPGFIGDGGSSTVLLFAVLRFRR